MKLLFVFNGRRPTSLLDVLNQHPRSSRVEHTLAGTKNIYLSFNSKAECDLWMNEKGLHFMRVGNRSIIAFQGTLYTGCVVYYVADDLQIPVACNDMSEYAKELCQHLKNYIDSHEHDNVIIRDIEYDARRGMLVIRTNVGLFSYDVNYNGSLTLVGNRTPIEVTKKLIELFCGYMLIAEMVDETTITIPSMNDSLLYRIEDDISRGGSRSMGRRNSERTDHWGNYRNDRGGDRRSSRRRDDRDAERYFRDDCRDDRDAERYSRDDRRIDRCEEPNVWVEDVDFRLHRNSLEVATNLGRFEYTIDYKDPIAFKAVRAPEHITRAFCKFLGTSGIDVSLYSSDTIHVSASNEVNMREIDRLTRRNSRRMDRDRGEDRFSRRNERRASVDRRSDSYRGGERDSSRHDVLSTTDRRVSGWLPKVVVNNLCMDGEALRVTYGPNNAVQNLELGYVTNHNKVSIRCEDPTLDRLMAGVSVFINENTNLTSVCTDYLTIIEVMETNLEDFINVIDSLNNDTEATPNDEAPASKEEVTVTVPTFVHNEADDTYMVSNYSTGEAKKVVLTKVGALELMFNINLSGLTPLEKSGTRKTLINMVDPDTALEGYSYTDEVLTFCFVSEVCRDSFHDKAAKLFGC